MYTRSVTTAYFFGARERVSKILPDALVIPAVLSIPVLAVIVVMLYWLWRVRFRRNFRAIPGISVPEQVKAHT